MKIVFTGHRDKIGAVEMLDAIAGLYEDAIWVHGGATGFDAQVSEYARTHHIGELVVRPDYKQFAARVAPIMRNKAMLAQADLVVACYDGRKSGGTYLTISEARKLGIKVIILPAHHHKSTQAV
jgi:hypothetical protein